MHYYLLHLGCQMNQSDAERIRTVLNAMGLRETDSEDDAVILGIVACSVRQKAIDKVYTKIEKWNSRKQQRALITFVSGCILESDRRKFLKRFDLVFDPQSAIELPDMIRQYGAVIPLPTTETDESAVLPPSTNDGSPRSDATGFWQIPASHSSSFEAYVPIQNGCDKFCTYCAVPYTRGRELSRPSTEIVQEVGDLIARGYRSITLLGQNVNSYGKDKNGSEIAFPQLLRQIGALGEATKHEFRVYFTSPHPRDMTDDVIDAIAEFRCIAKQIHLPLQSGDDTVLARMNRNHNLDQFRHIVERIRVVLPSATLFTDIIVGFPGETIDQFENTRRAMREFAFNMAYVAVYSPRPGARSEQWSDDVPHREKKRRLHELSIELQHSALAHNEALLGKTLRVLVDGNDRKPGFRSGKTEGRTIVRFPATATDHAIGSFVDVTITAASPLSVEGRTV